MTGRLPNRPFLVTLLLSTFMLGGCVESDQATLQNGIIMAAVPANQASGNMSAGAIAGAVLLGAAGGSVGEGAGKAAAVMAGILVGGTAGSAAEATIESHDGVAYTIRLTDGRVITVVKHLGTGKPILGVGTKVIVETSGNTQRVLARSS